VRPTLLALVGFSVALVVAWCAAFLLFPDANYERVMSWMFGAGILGALAGWRSGTVKQPD